MSPRIHARLSRARNRASQRLASEILYEFHLEGEEKTQRWMLCCYVVFKALKSSHKTHLTGIEQEESAVVFTMATSHVVIHLTEDFAT